MKRIPLLLLLSLLGFQLSAQESCMQPDVNCDGLVNVNDLLIFLPYYGNQSSDPEGPWGADGVCSNPDINCDGTIDVNDLLELLQFFGTIPGCTDPSAANYQSYATSNDGTCTYPNGSSVCDFESAIFYEGHTYGLVGIGDQCWFAENLQSEVYSNGDSISHPTSLGEWNSTFSGAQVIYNNDPWYLNHFGRLYNWFAVNDARGLCPNNWHIPSDSEYMVLEIELGMSESEANADGERGSDQGDQMKSSMENFYPWNGTNASGFSGISGGIYHIYEGSVLGDFLGCGSFWTASEIGESAWNRSLWHFTSQVVRESYDKRYGSSVRCIKDAE